MFTGCLYSEDQFYIHSANWRRQGLFTVFNWILIGSSKLLFISEMIDKLNKAPKNNILLKALIFNHSKF